MKKTKIICTIGPASEQEPVMLTLIKNGMNVVRMNFSHGKFDDGVENEQAFRIKTTREINEKYGTNIALLLDTKGPEIRTGKFDDNGGKNKIEIAKGSTVRVAMKDCLGTKDKFSVSYPGLYDDMNIGDYVLVDDGYLTLEVIEKDAANKELITKALNTHRVKSKRGINIPGVKLNMPFISDEDRHDLVVAAAGQQLDFVAASFTRRASDVKEMRQLLTENGNDHIQIIAKIENQEGVDNLEEIMDAADGIMVARGDLGIEIPAWEVPVIQKRIVRECQKKGKICVVATQMLESMQNNPRPTRAEVSDVANAVLEGADATMLSGETTGGDYPKEAVEYMGKINNRMSSEIDYEKLFDNAVKEHSDNDFQRAFAMDAAKMALEYKEAVAIVTIGGKAIAKEVSRFRPIAPIIALVDNCQDARSLAMNFGIYPVCGNEKDAIDFIMNNIDNAKGKVAIVAENNAIKVVNL